MKMKKKIWAWIAVVAMLVVMLPTTAFAAGGTGTEADPIVISTEVELKAFADEVNAGADFAGKYVKLGADITITSTDWEPIGNGSRSGSGCTGAAFKGVFDGNGKTITGLTIVSGSGDEAIGLFGVVDGGTVKNLVLAEVDINVPNNECAGGAIGLMVNNATADNITVSGSVIASRGNGGIVGRMTIQGTIANCTNNANVTATTTSSGNVGGIVGAAYYTADGKEMSIKDCVNNGAITSGAHGAGGIVGLSAANVDNCKNTAIVTGSGTSIGGIVGEQQNYGSVTNCTNTAKITNTDDTNASFGTGGIVGWVRYNGTESNYPAKEVITVTGNTNTGDIIGGASAGGIVGHVYNAINASGNENTASKISASVFAAGVVGTLQIATGNTYETEPVINVLNNVSATTDITAQCVDEYGYDNSSGTVGTITDNSEEWVAQIGDVKYATMDYALENVEVGDTLTILVADKDENLEIPEGITVENKTGHDIKVNGQVVTVPSEPETDGDNTDNNTNAGTTGSTTTPSDTTSPKTGDASAAGLYVVAAFAAVAAIGGFRMRRTAR